MHSPTISVSCFTRVLTELAKGWRAEIKFLIAWRGSCQEPSAHLHAPTSQEFQPASWLGACAKQFASTGVIADHSFLARRNITLGRVFVRYKGRRLRKTKQGTKKKKKRRLLVVLSFYGFAAF